MELAAQGVRRLEDSGWEARVPKETLEPPGEVAEEVEVEPVAQSAHPASLDAMCGGHVSVILTVAVVAEAVELVAVVVLAERPVEGREVPLASFSSMRTPPLTTVTSQPLAVALVGPEGTEDPVETEERVAPVVADLTTVVTVETEEMEVREDLAVTEVEVPEAQATASIRAGIPLLTLISSPFNLPSGVEAQGVRVPAIMEPQGPAGLSSSLPLHASPYLSTASNLLRQLFVSLIALDVLVQ